MAKETKSKWTPNETQKAFLQVLAERGEVTLFELGLEGIVFKSGAINTLIKQGLVDTSDERKFVCDVVFNGKVVGKQTKTAKVWRLKAQD